MADDLPDECWESVFHGHDDQRHLEALSLVSKCFLSISNRVRSTLTISDLTILDHGTVSRLLRRFQQLKRIDLVEFHGDLDRLVREIARSGLNLEALNLSNQKRFPVESMKEMGAKMKSLRILICSRLRFLHDSDLIVIADSFPLLEELDISYPVQDYRSLSHLDFINGFTNSSPVTNEGIAVLSSKLSGLRKVNLSGNKTISNRSLLALSSNCVFLRGITVHDCNYITLNGIGLAIHHNPNLISLSIHGSNRCLLPLSEYGNNPSVFPPPSTFQNSLFYVRALRTLDFSLMRISDDFLNSIGEANLPLQKLIISRCRGFSFTGISSLLYVYQCLNCLDLGEAVFLTDQNMIELSHYLHNLTSITLNSCSKLTNSTFFTLTKTCPFLEEIRMERTRLGKGDTPKILEKNHRIRSLKLAWNKYVSDETLKKIGIVCPKVRLIDVSRCWCITEEGIGEIGKSCCEIRELQVNGCIRMRNIWTGSNLSKLEVLRAGGTRMNDEGLSMVAHGCRGLLHLDLEGCLRVTTRGVKEVVGSCKGLRELSLKQCLFGRKKKQCYEVYSDLLPWMVLTRPSLRKIILQTEFAATEKHKDLLLRHGCLVYKSGKGGSLILNLKL